MNFLIAEDFEFNALILSENLKILGDSCTIVNNGQEALDIMKVRTDFDAILMDLDMPILDGRLACRYIKSDKQVKTPSIPIIAISGYELEEVKIEQKIYGFDYILTKPININELINLKELIEIKK